MAPNSLRRRLLVVVSLVGTVAALWYSAKARDPAPSADDTPLSLRDSQQMDEATGAVLVDLADDAGEDERREVRQLLRRAIAPFQWKRGLGEMLSDEAELYRLHPPRSEVLDIVRKLAGHEDVEVVELERIWRLPEMPAGDHSASAKPDGDAPETARGPFRPNDPYYRYQWHLDQIQMPQAWLRSRGEGVVVAVIDTGVSYRNEGSRFRRAPDLAPERLVQGYDFVENDETPDDEHGHGTHVAGTVAQSTHNGIGVAGVAPGAAIMPVRVLDRRGAGRWGSVAAGIRWAADNGAHVINLSLGGATPSGAIRSAIAHAHRKGVVVVAAAGNTGRGRVQYPAAHRHAIAVGAVRFDERLSFYSSFGRHLDVVAPGGDLRVDQNGDGRPDGVLQNTIVRGNPTRHDYLAFQGTSMAAPHVAGVAALLRGSGVQDPGAIERLLKQSAKPKSDARRYGSGLIQADAAIRAATQQMAGARGGVAALLGALLLFGLRRRRRLGVSVNASLAVAFVTAGGLAALPWASVGLSSGWASLWGSLAGHAALNTLIFSALPALGLVAVAYGLRRGRFALVGLLFGLGGVLVVEAFQPSLAFGLIPHSWIGPWLLANAMVIAVFARQVALRDRT